MSDTVRPTTISSVGEAQVSIVELPVNVIRSATICVQPPEMVELPVKSMLPVVM